MHPKPPVLFIIFNRLDTALRVFEQIRSYQPEKLYIAADGPRAQRPGEAEKVAACREAIVSRVDWPCDIMLNFRQENKGCRKNVSGAITWFFQHEEAGIVLEDDCLPHPSFFGYCAELLTRFRDDERVMLISGDNFQRGQSRTPYSYYYTRYPHIWGWASWRRAWQHYSVSMPGYPAFMAEGGLEAIFKNPHEVRYWKEQFDAVYEERLDTWDYQWVYTMFSQGGAAICPNVNLVSNIGFGGDSTHTHNQQDPNASIPAMDIGALRHPQFFYLNREADEFTAHSIFGISKPGLAAAVVEWSRRVSRKVKRRLPLAR